MPTPTRSERESAEGTFGEKVIVSFLCLFSMSKHITIVPSSQFLGQHSALCFDCVSAEEGRILRNCSFLDDTVNIT